MTSSLKPQVEINSQPLVLAANKHIPVLDGLRAIAVLMVIVVHFWQIFSDQTRSLVGKIAMWGGTGVDLFFVLSGFLITGILLESRGSHNFLRNFYWRRVLRIFPLYYATLVSIYLLCPLLQINGWTPWSRSIWFWTYLQNIPATFSPSLMSGPNHFWSLAVEEHYYLFWPVMVLLLSRNRLLVAAAAAIATSLITRIIFIQHGVFLFYFTMARLDGLAIGSALAILARRRPEQLARFVSPAKYLLWVLASALIVIQLLVSGRALAIVEITRSTLVAVIYACVLILAIENAFGSTVARLLSGRVLGSVGRYSYAMYVLHPFILAGLHKAGLSYSAHGLLISFILTYLAAWVSWTLLEKRFLRLKTHFQYSLNRSSEEIRIAGNTAPAVRVPF